MELKEKIQQNLKTALKEKDENRSSTLKMLLASINNKEIELKKKEEGLSEEETQNVIRAETKKRHESIEAYEKGGRPELAEKEKAELSILQTYLPPELSDEEIEKMIKETIEELKAESGQDFGRVMGAVMAKLKGQASGDRVNQMVKQLLNQES